MALQTAEQLSGIPVGPSAGSQIGNYQILGKVGSGGMATVYLSRATGVGGFEREVALKLVHEHLAEDDEHKSYLLKEARLAARIRHRNVVQVFDVGESDSALYLVMEYVEGGTLDALVHKASARGETLPLPIALRIITDALSGLHAAHEAQDDLGKPLGLVHRDFSPQNILVGVDGAVKLADFGIAKLTRSMNQTRSGTLKGKANYMAPEQVRSQHLDRRCDVWAAGVVCWELLAGERLQPRLADEMATLMRILTVRPSPLRSVNPKLPEALELAVANALEQRLDKRCPSAEDFRDRLLAAAKESGIELSDPLALASYVQAELGDVLTTRRAKISASRKGGGLIALDTAPEAGQTRTGFTSKIRNGRGRKDRTLPFVLIAATLVTLGVVAGRFTADAPPAAPAPPPAHAGPAALPLSEATPVNPVSTSVDVLPTAGGASPLPNPDSAPSGTDASETDPAASADPNEAAKVIPANPQVARAPRVTKRGPRKSPTKATAPPSDTTSGVLAPNPYRETPPGR